MEPKAFNMSKITIDITNEPSSKRQCTNRHKVVYCTDSESLAKSLDYNVKVKCSDGVTAYTTWAFFTGIDYFLSLIKSGMKESTTKELEFQYLNYEDTVKYISIVAQATMTDGYVICEDIEKSVFNLYSQADMHGVAVVTRRLIDIIVGLPWSLDWYYFMIGINYPIGKILDRYLDAHKISSTDHRVDWCKDLEVPPMSESIFWNNLMIQCDTSKITYSWCVYYRFIPLDKLKEALNYNTTCPTIEDIKLLTKCPQKGKDSELLMLTNWCINKQPNSSNKSSIGY